jgi:LysR family hydrogen peroxide-inducible transcriptional activator|tara:strand:+ start:223 stop:1176 length:954 start_codon:yes stop_codon:yes gene_type:complete
MTITQLKYVISVAEYKNFTVAAEHSFVTQPTLSMQIQKLEDQLGVLIFNRSKKPIELTDVGKKVVEQAKVIVNESNRIVDIVHQYKGFIGGEFRLGIIPTVMPTLLPMFLNNFTKKYSKVKLIIEELTTEEIIKKLSENHLDAGLAATPLENEAIKEMPLYYEPFVGLIPKEHRLFHKKEIESGELEMEDILLLEDGHCFKDSVINLCRTYNTNNNKGFKLESGSFDTLIKLSKEGLGMTLLPYLHTLDLNEKDKKLLREFTSPQPAREISLIYHKSQLKIQLIDALKNSIDGVIRGAISFNDVKIISPLQKSKLTN